MLHDIYYFKRCINCAYWLSNGFIPYMVVERSSSNNGFGAKSCWWITAIEIACSIENVSR